MYPNKKTLGLIVELIREKSEIEGAEKILGTLSLVIDGMTQSNPDLFATELLDRPNVFMAGNLEAQLQSLSRLDITKSLHKAAFLKFVEIIGKDPELLARFARSFRNGARASGPRLISSGRFLSLVQKRDIDKKISSELSGLISNNLQLRGLDWSVIRVNF